MAKPGRSKILVTGLLLLGAWIGKGQISPGDLTSAHAHLEGISNCTKCHVIGQKVTNAKCLECHTEIDTRMDRDMGYHASREVRSKDCFDCHSEHHGRKFDMVRFDEDAFNHRLTGFELTGAHARVDCRSCHMPDNIVDPNLRDRPNTFLGLSRECAQCHEDYHQGTLSGDCASCHTTESFDPASRFNHDKADFALLGKHESVDCIDCHQMETRAGKEFQQFTGLDFDNCNSCHEDAHNNNLGTNCKQCHNEQGFESTASIRNFNHSLTRFALKGQHRRLDCAKCHNMDVSPTRIFQDNPGLSEQACATCHEDVHEGRFGTNCAECHSENSWQAAIDLERFNHDMTGFALEGKHQVVDCRQCHVSENLTDPLPHNTCVSCHDDYHKGEFASIFTEPAIENPDCAQCHTVDGFSPAFFTIEDHAKSSFPLEGGHLATPCLACHLLEGEWTFRNIGNACVDCHENIHQNEIASEFFPGEDCTVCHNTGGWKREIRFDHSLTTFALEGAHMRADCAVCHLRDEEEPPVRVFADLGQSCTTCHENIHGDQFAISGETDCRRCHAFEDWSPVNFDHAKTDFPLEGRHAEIECAACHEADLMDNVLVVRYQMESFECIDCHN